MIFANKFTVFCVKSYLLDDNNLTVSDRPIHVAFAVPKKNYVQNIQDKDTRPKFNSSFSEGGLKPSVKSKFLNLTLLMSSFRL